MKKIKSIKNYNTKKIISFDNDEEIVVNYSDEIVEEINQDIIDLDKKKSYNLSLRYLSYKDRTISEMRKYLKLKNFDENTIEATVNKLIEENLLNDYEYSKKFISYKSINNNWGEYKIYNELKNKGVDENIIKYSIKEYFECDFEKLCNLISKKYFDEYEKDKIKAINKALSYLQRRGHSYSFSKKIVDSAFSKKEI